MDGWIHSFISVALNAIEHRNSNRPIHRCNFSLRTQGYSPSCMFAISRSHNCHGAMLIGTWYSWMVAETPVAVIGVSCWISPTNPRSDTDTIGELSFCMTASESTRLPMSSGSVHLHFIPAYYLIQQSRAIQLVFTFFRHWRRSMFLTGGINHKIKWSQL